MKAARYLFMVIIYILLITSSSLAQFKKFSVTTNHYNLEESPEPVTVMDPTVIEWFHPRNEDWWTGCVERVFQGFFYRGINENIQVGEVLLGVNIFRGFAKFDLSALPNDVCIMDVWLYTDCELGTPSEDHEVCIRQLNLDPQYTRGKTLYDDIGDGEIYYCGNLLNPCGSNTFQLGGSIVEDVQNMVDDGWFAVGFLENGDDNYYGQFYGHSSPSGLPALRIEYVLPPYGPNLSSPLYGDTIDDSTPTFDWDDVEGANMYWIQVDNNSDFLSPEIDAESTISTYSPFSSIDDDEYYWHVKARNVCDQWSGWSNVWYFIMDTETGISDHPSTGELLPTSFSMSQNYPNPFNPSTTISFDIPGNVGSKNHLNLSIYDIRGRLVRTLLSSALEPGHYKVTWNGKDENGESVSSGIYLYILKAGEKTYIRKMTILK
jgi:hypothetical protein